MNLRLGDHQLGGSAQGKRDVSRNHQDHTMNMNANEKVSMCTGPCATPSYSQDLKRASIKTKSMLYHLYNVILYVKLSSGPCIVSYTKRWNLNEGTNENNAGARPN